MIFVFDWPQFATQEIHLKANGHFVFEEIGEFVNALDIYHILAADTEEQIGIQLLFQVTQRLIDGYRITITKVCSNDTILWQEITNVSCLDKFEAIKDMHKEMISPFLACCHPHFLHQIWVIYDFIAQGFSLY